MLKRLCLLWQQPETRQYYHVGNLVFTESSYIFSYETTNKNFSLTAALNAGYQLHPSFPDPNKSYESNKLFNCFARRLPNFKRKDIQEKYKQFGMTETTSYYDVLSLTGGKFIGDHYEFVKPIKFNENRFYLDFYVRGWRHHNDMSFTLPTSEPLFFEPDEKNEYDPDAVKIMCSNKTIGYVPAFYSSFIKTILKNGDQIIVSSYSFNEKAPSALKLSLKINGEVTNTSINEYHSIVVIDAREEE